MHSNMDENNRMEVMTSLKEISPNQLLINQSQMKVMKEHTFSFS